MQIIIKKTVQKLGNNSVIIKLSHKKKLNEYSKDYYLKNKSRIIYNRYKRATIEFIETKAKKTDLIELKNKIDQLIKER